MKKFHLFLTVTVLCVIPCFCVNAEETLKVGIHPEMEPFEYYDEDGNLCGIDVDLAQLIAQEEELDLEIIEMEFDQILNAVASGKVDLGFSAITITDERKEIVDFSDHYLNTALKIVTRYDSQIEDTEKFESLIVGVLNGSTAYDYVLIQKNMEPLICDNPEEIIERLNKKDVDMVILDEETAKILVEENKQLFLSEKEVAQEQYAIAVRKDHEEILDELNQILATLKETGELQMVIDKYIIIEETEETE